MIKRSKELEHLSLFVANLMNKEQDKNSDLVASLRAVIGKTNEFDNIVKILNQIYDAKIEMLEKVYQEIQSL